MICTLLSWITKCVWETLLPMGGGGGVGVKELFVKMTFLSSFWGDPNKQNISIFRSSGFPPTCTQQFNWEKYYREWNEVSEFISSP